MHTIPQRSDEDMKKFQHIYTVPVAFYYIKRIVIAQIGGVKWAKAGIGKRRVISGKRKSRGRDGQPDDLTPNLKDIHCSHPTSSARTCRAAKEKPIEQIVPWVLTPVVLEINRHAKPQVEPRVGRGTLSVRRSTGQINIADRGASKDGVIRHDS